WALGWEPVALPAGFLANAGVAASSAIAQAMRIMVVMRALYHARADPALALRVKRYGPIDWVWLESRDSETEAPVSASGSMAMSSSLPDTEPWQPPHTLLKNCCGTPREMRSPGPSWSSSVIVNSLLPEPSCSSRTIGVSDGSRRCVEPSDASVARPSPLRFE